MDFQKQLLPKYNVNNYSEIIDISIIKLSKNANISTSTIDRCMKKLDYKGFIDFKYQIASKDANKFSEPLKHLERIDSQIQAAIVKNQEEVDKTIRYLNYTIIEDDILAIKYSKKISILARGFSEHISNKMTIKLQLLNKHTAEHNDPNIIKIKAESFNQDDLVIFISLNGETEELIKAVTLCKKTM